MGLFRRRPPPAGEPDGALPFLTRDAADRFRRQAGQAFAEAGVETTVHLDHLVDGQGREFGFHNLATVCRTTSERFWPDLMRSHVRELLARLAEPSVLDTIEPEAALAVVLPRLRDRRDLPPGLVLDYGVPFSDDVVELLELDQPTMTITLTDTAVLRLGGRTALRRAGLRNLLAVLPGLEVAPLTRPDGTALVFVASASFSTASLVLVMPELLEALGLSAAPYGVLVALPFRNELVLHVVRDAAVLPSLQTMVEVARSAYADNPGPVSPDAFWWHRGTVTQLSREAADGTVGIHITAEFQEVLQAVVRGP